MHAVSPDLLFLDLNMPQRDGLELLHAIRSDPKLKSTPIVIVTAACGVTRKRAIELGATHVLGKPFDKDDLVACVQEVLNSTA